MSDDTRSVGDRIATSAFWSIGMRVGMRALGLVSVIILARILVPEDFGIVAKASMIASFLEMMTEFGLEAALIQNQKAEPAHYDTVWTVHVIRGLVIGFTLVVLAVPAADFLNEPVLEYVLLFYALSSVLKGLENIGVVDFRKHLIFDKDFRFNILKKVSGFVAVVSTALVWRSYWAFVVGVVTMSSVGLVASYVMSNYRPTFCLNKWRSLFHFSKWIFFAGLVGSISSKLDTFILSRFSTTEEVGKYTVAHEIAGAASTELAMPIARATMPGLSMLATESDEFRDTYTTSLLVVMLIVVPAALGLSALADPVTIVVLGTKWTDAAPILEILAIYGILRALYSMSASAFLGSGEVKTFALLHAFNLVIRALAMGHGFYHHGVVGMAVGVLVASAVQNSVSLVLQANLGFMNLRVFFLGVWRTLLAAVLMFLFLHVLRETVGWVNSVPTVSRLAIQIAIGGFLYVGCLAAIWRMTGSRHGPEAVVLGYVSSMRKRTASATNES